ncbi:MAG: hypothetical protein ACP5M1_09780, partial [Acidiphilium sp.]
SLLNVTTSSGTVMLAALPIILGLQLLLSFIGYDIASVPSRAIFPTLPERVGPERVGPGPLGSERVGFEQEEIGRHG